MRLLALFCAPWVLAAQVSAHDETPLFRTTTRVVEVTVQADWSARAQARQLALGDLQLFDNNQLQTIKTFEPAGPADPQGAAFGREPAHRAARRSILLFDALNTSWTDQAYARHQAAKALEQVPPGETVAIFLLGNGLRLVQDFSSDRAALQALIRRLSGEAPKDGSIAGDNPFSAALPTFTARARSDSTYAAWAQRQRILQTFSALRIIARIMKGVPGQKNLLWLSAAFPLRIGMDEMDAAGGSAVESFNNEAVATTRDLSAANVTIYPIDARGLTVSSRAWINISSMIELASLTGGKAFYNTNDLASMIRAAMEGSREGYVLTYSPAGPREDGKFHTIRLRCGLRGVHLRYRQGYWADTPAKKPGTVPNP